MSSQERKERRERWAEIAKTADDLAAEWARETLDITRDGKVELVNHPLAISALQRAYAKVLKREGMDCVVKLTTEEASAFPSQRHISNNGFGLMAWTCQAMQTGNEIMPIAEFLEQRAAKSVWLAAGLDANGVGKFIICCRTGSPGPELDRLARWYALHMLALGTLDKPTLDAINKASHRE